jgi:putative ATPase
VADDLFTAAVAERLRAQAPLAARMRPRRLEEVVGQRHLLAPGAALRRLIEADRISSTILWGPPGTGKTTLAEVIAHATQRHFERLSAVTAGVREVRAVIEAAEERLGQRGRATIVFVDEIHRFSTSQQDALLPSVETGVVTLVGATTENPYFEVNAPLRSRSTLFRLEPLARGEVHELLTRALVVESAEAEPDALDAVASRCGGDARQALTTLEVACALARPGRVTLAHVDAALGVSAMRYGRDDHYDVVSALIKSIRGSDPDAGLFWLARMLEAGDDPRFVARRLVILASEDVGMADPQSLLVAVAAAQAVETVGMPEAQLTLAQAVVHLATAPKSNRVALGIWAAREEVRSGADLEVPSHLRDGHFGGARDVGHGVGYAYPHDDPRGWVPQRYLPEGLAPRQNERDGEGRYYRPGPHGAEVEVARRLRSLRERDERHEHDERHGKDGHDA